jgi:site-specific recombinase XerD
MAPMSPIAPTLESFFAERLLMQRRVSPRTIACYPDSLKLLLTFAWQQTGKPPSALDWADLDAELIGAFLDHLEAQRHNAIRTRNLRLTAIRALFTYAALRHPEHAALIQRVLAIPGKQFVSFLTADESDALLAAPTSPAGKAAATGHCSWWLARCACSTVRPANRAAPRRTGRTQLR